MASRIRLPVASEQRVEKAGARISRNTVAMDYDVDQLRFRFAEIRENVALLREAAKVNEATFSSDANLRDATMFRLLIAIEAAQAICVHLSSRLPVSAPESMAGCFECLRSQSVLNDELTARMVQMSKFRNLLVHRYWNVDPAQVHGFLATGADDLEAYLAQVGHHIGEGL